MYSGNPQVDQALNLFGKADEDAERVKTYQEAIRKYPLGKGDCATVKSIIEGLNQDISKWVQQKATDGGKGTVQNRYIDGYSKRLSEMQKRLSDLGCAAAEKAAQTEADYQMQLNLLDQAKGLTDKAGSATKYIIWGMLGIVVIVSGIIIIKKINK
jgi:hypothetical protein